MTDFDARAMEIVNADNWPDVQCTVGGAEAARQIIATALKAAYNEGLEAAALDMQNKFKVHIRGEKIALYGCAEAVRAKKVPT